MSCILTISGTDFDVDAFVSKSGISVYSVFRKGEPMYRNDVDGPKTKLSGCSAEVSKADFNAFKQQVEVAIIYLRENSSALKHIPSTEGIDHALLDFGVTFDPANGFVQNQYIPTELLIPAAEFGIGINLSMYTPPSDPE